LRLPWKLIAEWISEGEACIREARRVLVEGRTRYQEYVIAELAGLGKALVIDGKVQSSLLDEHWYHEALVHPVLLSHPCPRRVLVVGGGEGATIREVLKHRCVESVEMVDIDGELVESAKRLLPEWHRGAFSDPRVRLVIADGRRFVEQRREEYDVVILDVVDPTEGGPASLLYTREFYSSVKEALRGGGIVVTQATSPTLTPNVFASIVKTLGSVFKHVRPYVTYVRSYNGLWGFAAASDALDPGSLGEEEVERLIRERIEGELRFYDPATHRWLFTLPKPLRETLASSGRVATDEEPISVPV